MQAQTINPILLLAWTVIWLLPIYLVLVGGLYLVRRYLPEARGLLEMTLEPILFFPAVICAFLIALALSSR